MDERYRWNEERRRYEEIGREDEPRRWRDEGERSELKGRDYYGVSGDRGRGERNDNRSWEGREPYPKDVGGINRPGEDRSFGGRDPLTGDRGSAGGYSNAERDRGDYRGAQYGQTYGGGYTGQTGTGYASGGSGAGSSGGYGAGQAGRDYRADRGGGRYIEGGYEDYTPHYDRQRDFDREREHEARSWWAKARDEFRAWMGDREAERRLRMDHERDDWYGRHGGDWRGHDDDTGWRDPVSPGGDDRWRAEDWRDAARGEEREEYRRDEPREHRPGWFRDDGRSR